MSLAVRKPHASASSSPACGGCTYSRTTTPAILPQCEPVKKLIARERRIPEEYKRTRVTNSRGGSDYHFAYGEGGKSCKREGEDHTVVQDEIKMISGEKNSPRRRNIPALAMIWHPQLQRLQPRAAALCTVCIRSFHFSNTCECEAKGGMPRLSKNGPVSSVFSNE
jgi:hypothetical protein